MLTVCASYCQDRHRSSKGCAAWGRKATGFVCALRRRLEPGFPRFPARKYLWGLRFWSPSHSAASCGGAPLGIKYIKNRKHLG
jgi:hypothetical protein